MLSKQLTSRLKEEQEKERENQQNNNTTHLSASQCDRLIRTVSCKVAFDIIINKQCFLLIYPII
jgi:hypothetical protein